MAEISYLNPDVQLAMAYASRDQRDSFTVLFLLDDALAKAVNATREPMLGRIRLSWWRENLEAMAVGGMAPPEPLFQEMAKLALPSNVLSLLACVAEGWDVLLDDFPLSADALQNYARLRGHSLFEAAAVLVGADTAKAGALGEAWALAHIAAHCRDVETAQKALGMSCARFDVVASSAMPRKLRPFAIVSHLARLDLQECAANRPAPGSPRRMLRAAKFALFRK